MAVSSRARDTLRCSVPSSESEGHCHAYCCHGYRFLPHSCRGAGVLAGISYWRFVTDRSSPRAWVCGYPDSPVFHVGSCLRNWTPLGFSCGTTVALEARALCLARLKPAPTETADGDAAIVLPGRQLMPGMSGSSIQPRLSRPIIL